jgi:5-methyltetrahydropteroyltriglutamate--homocysteine methyltransferase
MAIASNLGFPRIGHHRQLKQVTEKYWAGKASLPELLDTGKAIRAKNWQMQKEAGIEQIPSNDFSFYDHILDAAITFGAIPDHYLKIASGNNDLSNNLDIYFHLARGCANDKCSLHPGKTMPALEMTKWFDTNYHYIVPELKTNQEFKLYSQKPIHDFKEAKALGIHTRPVIIGPVSFLMLAKTEDEKTDRFSLLTKLLPLYLELFKQLENAGADWIQIDEPCLVLDLDSKAKQAFKTAYETLTKSKLKLLLATYFGALGENLDLAISLPTAGIHLDFVREPEFTLDAIKWPKNKILSAGVVDGRNIWICDLEKTVALLNKLKDTVGSDNLFIAPSCSLLHTPLDLDDEKQLDTQIRSWLAFAKQKINEVSLLTKALNSGTEARAKELDINKKAIADHHTSPRVHNAQLKLHLSKLSPDSFKRQSSFKERKAAQQKLLHLPLLPTTTIGSFPQTKEIRKVRADFKAGKINEQAYIAEMEREINHAIAIQDEIGLDVLVHGEPERNDMVEYFAEFLDGYVFTEQGWVQSYGSRCVKPPIIFGDIVRREAMTVRWSVYAQKEANKLAVKKPVKGMLTGPVTMLQWSFVRNDQPRSQTCQQLAWAIREEVNELEKNGISIIQIDEPAIREGLPLKRAQWQEYLDWAVQCFRLASSFVKDETQIHTHMCYSEFNDIIESVAALDADVVSIEAARSKLDLLAAFVKFAYPNDIGPGVYDIHSPRVPPESEMIELLQKALTLIEAKQLWINPDCGLKTRGWPEVTAALKIMVDAAKLLRIELKDKELASTR